MSTDCAVAAGASNTSETVAKTTQLRRSPRKIHKAEAAFEATAKKPKINPFLKMIEKELSAKTQSALDSTKGDLPKEAGIERDRKVTQKPPLGVRGRNKMQRKTVAPKSATPHKRLSEFPKQGFSVQANQLYCRPCKMKLSLIKDAIKKHTLTSKHTTNLQKLHGRIEDDRDLKENLIAYYKDNPAEKLGNVDPDALVFRYRAAETFLYNGVAFERAYGFRNLLERSGLTLGDADDLKLFIPKIVASELAVLPYRGPTQIANSGGIWGLFAIPVSRLHLEVILLY